MWKLMVPIAAATVLMVGVGEAVGQDSPQDPSLSQFQGQILRRLTGAAEMRPGLSLGDRARPEARAVVRDYLASTLDSLGFETRRHVYGPEGENVYAVLPSTTGGGPYVVLGAHFDTVAESPGASDNATGCALVLGVARYLLSLPERRANVAVVFFDQEERGLLGSRAFARKILEDGWEVVAVHTVDQMGWDEDDDGAIELELPYPGAVDLYREAARRIGFSGAIHETREAGSDHSAFRQLGMPAVGLTEEYRSGDTTPHIHRPTDTFQTVDLGFLARVTRLVQKAVEILLT